jgi:penicillin amidase
MPLRPAIPSVLIACASLLGCSGGGGGGGGATGGGGTSPEIVTLHRDAHGVPHVYADTDRGALYGLGWASAEDRLFQMLWSRLMAQGRVAELFGPGLVAGVETHVEHDREARYAGWWRHAVRATSLLDAETLGLLEAYAAGVNDYMASPGAQLHPLIAQNGIPLDAWQPEDCIAVWLRFARHFSGDGREEVTRLREWEALQSDPNLTFNQAYNQMIAGVVCDESAAAVQMSRVPAATLAAMNAYAAALALGGAGNCPVPLPGPHFSQAWAVAGRRTTTGRAVLVGEPRGEVFGPNKYCEWSIEGATFSVRGIGVPGAPAVLSGTTPNVAWSPTALGMDQADLLSLVTDPVAQPGRYRYDGQWLPYSIDEVETIRVLGANDRQINYRETLWGPVVTPILPDVLPGEEFAVQRVPFVEPARETTAAMFGLYRAKDLDQLLAALEGWSWPPVNLVFADAGGRIGYSVVGDIPVRNPNLPLAGIVAQDGASSASQWIDRVPWGLQPHVLDPLEGYVLSANHMPVGSWYPIPIRFGSSGAGDTHRSRRLRERLEALPANPTPFEVFDARLDVVHPSRRDLVELAIWLRDRQASYALSPNATGALGELEPWWDAGAPMDDSLPGSTVAWLADLTFREPVTGPAMIDAYGGGDNGLNLFLKTKVADIRAVPAVPLASEEAGYVDRVLAEAWVRAQALGPSNTWPAWYRANVLTFQVSSWKSLEGLPPLTAQTLSVGPVRCADPQTLLSPRFQGYTQLASVGDPVLTRTLLPPGQSEHAGPLLQSQVPLWETEGHKPAPLSEQAVLAGGPVTSTQLVYTAPTP